MDLNTTILPRHKPGYLCLILVSRSETACVCVFEMQDAAIFPPASKTKVRNAKFGSDTVTKRKYLIVTFKIPDLNYLCNKTSQGCEISRLNFCSTFQSSVSNLSEATQILIW